MKYSKVRVKLIKWFRYYLFFSKDALFISGLVFTHSVVEHAVVDLLMSYITDAWKDSNLPIAAAAVNMQEVTTALAVILIAHMSDAYFGHYKMILFTTKAYFLGLVLLWMTGTKIWLLVVALLLLSVGKSGKEPPLKAFLGDQFRGNDQSLDGNDNNENQVKARTKVWWRFWWCLGFITATFVFPNVSWPDSEDTIKSAALMFITYWLFRLGEGLPYCQRPRPTKEEEQTAKISEASDAPLFLAYHVLKAAIMKRGLRYPDEDTQLFKNDSRELILLPNIPFFRWLDKAAILDPSSSISPEEQAMQGKLCSVAQVKKTKSLLKMVPMWATFWVYSVIEATGSTFFVEQTSNLSSPVHNNIFNLVIVFNAMTSFTSFLVRYSYGFVVKLLCLGSTDHHQDYRGKKKKTMLGLLLRIGFGMVSSILCCFAAWVVEARRLSMVSKKVGAVEDSDVDIGMSIWLLVPQFFLLGLMQGLAEDGLVDFFCDQVPDDDSIKCYAEPFTNGVLSFGKFVTILFVLAGGNWFGDYINRSHLDRYYRMLTFLSSGNLCFYCFVSYMYYIGTTDEEDAALVVDHNIKPHASLEDEDDIAAAVTCIGNSHSGSSRTLQSSVRQTTRIRSAPEYSDQIIRRHSFKISKSLEK